MVYAGILCALILISSVIFFLFAATAFKRNTPMPFWAGTTVKPEEIADIAAYNKANGIMWLVYAFLLVAAAFSSFYRIWLAGVLVGILAVLGLPVLIWVYGRIYRHYRR